MAEDFNASNSTPRNACLDAVASSDALVVMVGARGGWSAPSGKLVVQEEVEEALKKRKDVLLFVQDIARDADSEQLVRALSDYVEGRFRKTFRTPLELEALVQAAVAALCGDVNSLPRTEMNDRIAQGQRNPVTLQHEASVRLVLATERDEQVFDPLRFEGAEFQKIVNEASHMGEIPLMLYEHAKRSIVGPDSYQVTQEPVRGVDAPGSHVHLELQERGMIIVDVSVTGGREPLRGQVIAEPDIRSALQSVFAFSDALFARLDPHARHQRFAYNLVLHNGGYRMIVPDHAPRNSYEMRMSGNDDVVAYLEPRVIALSDLRTPDDEIERCVRMLERRYHA